MSVERKEHEEKAQNSLTNTIQEVDGDEVQIVEADADPRQYQVTNLTEAQDEADREGVSLGEVLDRHTYTTRVCHQRGLVLGTDDPVSRKYLQNPGFTHEDEYTGTVYDIAVARYLGYEVLTYDIDQRDIQNLKCHKEEFGTFDWNDIVLLRQFKDTYGDLTATAKRLIDFSLDKD